MKMVQIQELKQHLSELVDRAAGGEEVVITRHQRPVATLVGYGARSVHAAVGTADLAPLGLAGLEGILGTLADDRGDGR
jgi:prevent-host-death family protein